MQLLQMAQQGNNPMAMIQQMAMSDPAAAKGMQLLNGKSPAQLRQIAENMARERGTTLQQIAQQMGIRLP